MVWLLVLLTVLLLTGSADAEQRCTQRWNAVFQQWDISCEDGTTGTQRYNRVFDQVETETTTPSYGRGLRPTKRCVSRFNPVFQTIEQECD